MVTIREGTEADVERVNDFYANQRRGRDAQPNDFFLLAQDDTHTVVGVVRLCQDQGYALLRGMLIERNYREQGLGRQMLHALEAQMRDQDYYCFPFAHLIPFYEIIGFHTVADNALPDFLKTRLAKYHQHLADTKIQRLLQDDLGVYPPDGLKFIVMKRPKG